MTLAQLRRARGLRQIDIAQRLGVVQSRVSAIERTPLTKLEWGTLRSYLGAIGIDAQISALTTDGIPVQLSNLSLLHFDGHRWCVGQTTGIDEPAHPPG